MTRPSSIQHLILLIAVASISQTASGQQNGEPSRSIQKVNDFVSLSEERRRQELPLLTNTTKSDSDNSLKVQYVNEINGLPVLVQFTYVGPPKILPIATADSYPEGATINLICTVSGGQRKGLALNWEKDGRQLDDESLRYLNEYGSISIEKTGTDISILRIANATHGDSGRYTCKARNPVGEDSTSAQLVINVELKWNKLPVDSEVGLNKDISIECDATSEPNPIIQWIKLPSSSRNGFNDSDKPVIVSHGKYLKLTRAQLKDSGLYECTARNGADNLRRVIQLTVRVWVDKWHLGCIGTSKTFIMSQTRTSLNSVLLGDELGQIKLVQLDPKHVNQAYPHDPLRCDSKSNSPTRERYSQQNYLRDTSDDYPYLDNYSPRRGEYEAKTLGNPPQKHKSLQHRHKIIRIFSQCLQREPAASRAITSIRPIQSIYESDLDTTDKPNSLFLITNKVGQIFVCDTDVVRRKLRVSLDLEAKLSNGEFHQFNGTDHYICDDDEKSTILSPVYYNMNNKVQVLGAQPINQTNILVVYRNGDIQHVNIGQDILQSSLKIKRKAIRMLGLGYNSDARAVHWKIDGATGICYFDSDATSAHMNENDPLTDIVLSSPTHKLNKRRTDRSDQNVYNKSPCIQSRKHNEQDRLVPTQVINMITSRADQYKPNIRIGKWSSITSLNLIYRKLALYDLVGSENFEHTDRGGGHQAGTFKLNDNRLALGGFKYALRVYDVQTQKAIYNCLTGSSKNPLVCSSKGELMMVGDIDWLGGNKTTHKSPDMLATCSGVDSVVNVYDMRCVKPAFHMDLTQQTESKWQAYENYPRGCTFTSICASGAPYSTAVPSQQLALGSTNGQLHLIDLRFVAKSNRTLGKLSGFCGGSIREIRFVSESFETSKMISCASDRFIRIHRIQTSYTSVVSQRLATKVFLGTRPTCVQPVCDEISQQRYLASLVSHYGSESHISTNDSNSWSLL